jgi:hypothetical protein
MDGWSMSSAVMDEMSNVGMLVDILKRGHEARWRSRDSSFSNRIRICVSVSSVNAECISNNLMSVCNLNWRSSPLPFYSA